MPTKTKKEFKKNSENLFSHWNKQGEPTMVDVSEKKITQREAVARAILEPSAHFPKDWQNAFPKGNPWNVAQIAGIQAAKQTAVLIPLCHALPLDYINLSMQQEEKKGVFQFECTVRTTAKTGAEMEALTGVTIAALTFYDMVKAVDPFLLIHSIGLYQKKGGKKGALLNPKFKKLSVQKK